MDKIVLAPVPVGAMVPLVGAAVAVPTGKEETPSPAFSTVRLAQARRVLLLLWTTILRLPM